ncbi:hypothetical protein NUW54_g14658 [Trametes sanguinea]|uniref:Uncharacterized protein n=1 Tax=Trametes sanguinea TaxID=158606 RepID=A0ACC1MCV6_9APHY|nr:hypothetical protein NUW54_g14658 [Trametes sanguinea]
MICAPLCSACPVEHIWIVHRDCYNVVLAAQALWGGATATALHHTKWPTGTFSTLLHMRQDISGRPFTAGGKAERDGRAISMRRHARESEGTHLGPNDGHGERDPAPQRADGGEGPTRTTRSRRTRARTHGGGALITAPIRTATTTTATTTTPPLPPRPWPP